MEKADHVKLITNGSGRHAPRTALILYGSETGNAQDVAEEVARMAERLHFDTTVLDLDSASIRDLIQPSIVIFSISTTGQGEFPQNARLFWRRLLSGALKPGLLRKVRFASFGLGDSSYARFNVAHKMLCGRMVQLGAKLFCGKGEGNEQHPEGHSAGFREWIVALRGQLVEQVPLPDGQVAIPDDVLLEPKWQLDVAVDGSEEKEVVNGNVDGNGHAYHDQVLGNTKELAISADDRPSPRLLPVKDAYDAEIVSNERITAADHFQDVRLIDLRIENEYAYGPGAVAVVYPKNFPSDVQNFIDLMAWQDIADRPISLIASTSSEGQSSRTLSPLRHLDLSHTILTLRWLLENVLDIMSIPRRSFFASLAYFASTATEDEAYQKERLLELANPELIDELWDYTTRPKRTILEVMMDFTTIRIPWQYALTVLPMMKGRQFSIASGGALRRDEEGRTRVQLLVAIADPPSPIIKFRRRYGVCTRYIPTLEAGQHITIGLQQGYLDVRRNEMKVPVLMIGPGTGVAPMRAMVYQRLAWAEELGGDKHPRDDMLVFGCRSKNADYFFENEWARLGTNLTVLPAFSRDKLRPKQYVQDVIRDPATATRIYRMLVERHGKVYVCGSSGNMPKAVREALVAVLYLKGGDYFNGKEEAGAYVDRMEKEGRWKQETW